MKKIFLTLMTALLIVTTSCRNPGESAILHHFDSVGTFDDVEIRNLLNHDSICSYNNGRTIETAGQPAKKCKDVFEYEVQFTLPNKNRFNGVVQVINERGTDTWIVKTKKVNILELLQSMN